MVTLPAASLQRDAGRGHVAGGATRLGCTGCAAEAFAVAMLSEQLLCFP